MQNKKYSDAEGLSQSMIKDFRFKSPKKWNRIWLAKTEHDEERNANVFTFGDVVDTILFTPDLIEERFFVSDAKVPEGAVASIVEDCFDWAQITGAADMDSVKDYIPVACGNYYDPKKDKKGWNNSWKVPTKISKIMELGEDYFNSLAKSGGRKVISQQMNLDAIAIKEICQKDEIVKSYFVEEEGTELLFQFEIYVNHTSKLGIETPLKGAIDILRIDHMNKTIQIVDFKTTQSASNFIMSIKKYGYALQLSFYDYLLRLWLDQECKGKFCDYVILNPINIAIDNYDKVPYIYEYSWIDLWFERDGNEKYLEELFNDANHNAKIKKGWMSILEDICWHHANDIWDRTKEFYVNKKIKVNLLNT